MFNLFSVALVVFTTIYAVGGLVIPRADVPATYNAPILEPYAQYNARYMALGCENKHNTTFFDTCCHPMKAGETLETARPPQCNPANPTATVSSSDAPPTATPDGGDDGDLPFCDDEPDSSSTPTPTPTPAPVAAAPDPAAPAEVIPTTHSTTHTTSHTTSHTSTPKATPKATPAPAAAPAGNGQVFDDGVATFFTQNGVAGACGKVHSDNDLIAAIDQDRYGDSGATSKLCGQQVHIKNKNNGKTVTVTIADDCPTCNNGDSIDLSVGAFTQIATKEEGEVPIEWYFVN